MAEVSGLPGGIIIEDCKISNFDQSETWSLFEPLMEFNLYTSIFAPYIKGDLVFTDSLALSTRLPIIGEETLSLVFKRPNSDIKITVQARVVSMHLIRGHDRQAMCKIDFVSQSRIVDLMRVVRIPIGPEEISSMVKKVAKDFLAIEGEKIEVEDTIGKHKFVIPTWSPFQTMHFFCREADSAIYKAANFVFYEDHDKHHFKTIESMMSGAPKEEDTYTVTPQSLSRHAVDPDDPKNDEFRRVRHVEIISNFDVEKSLQNGMYGNKVYWVDTLMQQYEAVEIAPQRRFFKYAEEFPKFRHTAKTAHKVISSKSLLGQGQGDSHIRFIHSTPNQTFEKHQVTPRIRQNKLPYLVSSHQQLEHLRLRLTIQGDPNRKVGSLIEFDMQEFGATDDVLAKTHEFLRGRWLVTHVRHHYNQNSGYSTVLEVAKNAYEAEIKNQKAERQSGEALTPQAPVVMPPLPPFPEPDTTDDSGGR